MIENKVEPERLYLQKEDNTEVFLSDCQLLKQFQIDGLRFLFKQLKKKKPAAVLNYPQGCGKSVTVALFLSVIRNLIQKPILILCNNANEMDIWHQTLLKWTEFTSDDIAMDSSNVYIKKKIFIKNLENLTPYLRRSWSTVVTKGDINKSTLKLFFDADLRIWITSTDVKKDLKMLSLVYQWLTNTKMDSKDFITRGNTIKEKIENAVILDSFLEDFLIQENRIDSFEAQIINISTKNNELLESALKKRKNKDATGTKTKRSKKTADNSAVETNDKVSTNNNKGTIDLKENERYESQVSCSLLKDYGKLSTDKIIVDENNDHFETMSNENEISDDVDQSDNLLQTLKNIKQENMNLYNSTESLSFTDAVRDIVTNENIPSNNSTESIKIETNNEQNKGDAFDNKMSTSIENTTSDPKTQEKGDVISKANENEMCFTNDICDQGSVDLELNVDENTIKCEVAPESGKVLQECIDRKEMGTDENINESHKDIDAKLTELERKALKMFKGSLLDSIF